MKFEFSESNPALSYAPTLIASTPFGGQWFIAANIEGDKRVFRVGVIDLMECASVFELDVNSLEEALNIVRVAGHEVVEDEAVAQFREYTTDF